MDVQIRAEVATVAVIAVMHTPKVIASSGEGNETPSFTRAAFVLSVLRIGNSALHAIPEPTLIKDKEELACA